MEKLFAVFIILTGLIPKNSLAQDHQVEGSAERQLVDLLFQDYDPGSRPVLNAANAITINISISVIQIMDLVEKNQTLVTQLWICEKWFDETLNWKPDAFDGLESVIVPSAMLWLPDIYIFNNANSGGDGFITLNESRVTVHSNGQVEWIVPLIIQSTCTVDVTYFPFDRQACHILIGTWIYDENQVNLSLDNSSIDLSFYAPNTELDLLNASLKTISLPGKRPQISAFLEIRRKPLYYVYTILSPTLVLCILNLFSFMLPCDNGDKVGIGLTVFLSLYVLQLAVAENIPESNSLPLIGLFLTLVMTLNAISLVCATIVINVKKKGDLRFCPHVPDPIFNFCRNVLGRIMCTTFISFHKYYGYCKHQRDYSQHEAVCVSKEQLKNYTYRQTASGLDITGVFARHQNCRNGDELTARHSHLKQSLTHNNQRSVDQKSGRPRLEDYLTTYSNKGNSSPDEESRNEPSSGRGRNDGKIGRDSSSSCKCNAEDETRDPRHEWYFVAEVLDKMLFFVFLVTMLTTVIVLLVIIPFIHG